ncbi:hypothetical protein L0128_14080, partial [candidate division KSB1 bacterium]|nr:hypothetical protein [candidate division KSB1 bacterium]
LAKYLKVGKNVIAVKALYNGIENFQLPNNRPGFIAWGAVRYASGKISFETPGRWICKKSTGYDQNAVRFSFACAAMEIYDARQEPDDWKGMETDVLAWQQPVVIPNQDAWGKLSPRSIPRLTKNEITAKYVVGMYQLNDQEDLYSFRIKTPDEARRDYSKGPSIIGYTYIYSPVDQAVEAGLWWGEYYLNGAGPLPGRGENPARPNRDPRIFKLKKGWNFLNIHYGAIWGAWDFYLALPKSAGLHVSPTREFNSKYIVMTAGPLPWERNAEMKKLDRPFQSLENLLSQSDFAWQGQLRGGQTNNPALDLVWHYSDQKLAFADWQLQDLTIAPGLGTAIVLDIGGKTLGRLFIEADMPAGTVVDIGFSEDLYAGKPWLFKHKMISAAVRFVSNGKTKRFETFNPYGLRYLQVNISGHERPVTLKKIGVIEQIYPFEKIGSFQCSDPMFNAIWELGWRSLRVCAEDSYIDTPFRERGLYAGDMLPEYAITLAGSGDSRLVKRSLKVFHDKYNLVNFGDETAAEGEFPLINIVTSKWYYDYTADTALVKFIYAGYQHLVDRWLASADGDGLCYLGPQFIEWTAIEKSARLTATHALLARALEIVADYARILDKKNEAAYYQKSAEEMKQTVRTKFWDEQKQLFNDGYKEGQLSGKYYPTSNVWPLLYHCTSPDQVAKIMDYLEFQFRDISDPSQNHRITPYSAFYALAALYQQERADLAERFISQYWTRMILDGDDTAWENFDHGAGGPGTRSHAWSGHPTYFLTTEALGVNLGFHQEFDKHKIIIAPQSEHLSWAKGIVPHPLGPVAVAWRLEGEHLFLDYTAPAGVETVVQPKGRLAGKILWVNGKKVK